MDRMYRKYKAETSKATKESTFKPQTQSNVKNNDNLLSNQSSANPSSLTTELSNDKELVKQCWAIVDDQCPVDDSQGRVTTPCAPNKVAARWRIVRVFVSSTFVDFFNEREILVKKVFPELREWCEKRRLTLVDCDLRWGVPRDSTTATTIETCLAELDRCDEETGGVPFFLGLIGERYGWVPEPDVIPFEVRGKYRWVDGVSMTTMEILHGAYRKRNPNAAFFIRDPAVLEDIPDDHKGRFFDQESISKEHVKILKNKLVTRFPQQVFNYKCEVAGVELVAGHKRVKLNTGGDFTEAVSTFLKSAIERTLPSSLTQTNLTPEEQEDETHLLHMENRAQVVFGRDHQVEALVQFAMGKSDSDFRPLGGTLVGNSQFQTDLDEFGVTPSDTPPLCVIAPSGVGKSALMARVAQRCHKLCKGILYHAVGCSASSVLEATLLKRLLNKVCLETTWEELNSKTESQLLKLWKDTLCKCTDKQSLVIIIDSLNELATSNHATGHLSWLPPRLPWQLRLIVSANSNHLPTMEVLEKANPLHLPLETLSSAVSRTLATHYLGQFNKKLDDQQVGLLCGHPGASYPQWLVLACEELRIYGDFRTLTEKIRGLPGLLNGLLAEILTRVLAEDDTDIMKKLLCIIECSPGGIPESGILELLGNKGEPVPLKTWAVVRCCLKSLIRATALYTAGGAMVRINFAHYSVREAVQERLLSGYEEKQCWHAYLAEFYTSQCKDERLVVEQLPHHLHKAMLRGRLVSFYRTNPLSRRVHFHQRKRHMQALRCSVILPNNIPSLRGEFLLCYMCSVSTNRMGVFHPARDVCPVCGDFVPFKNHARKAYVCMTHRRHGGMKYCGLCGIILGMMDLSKMPTVTHALLCQQCGFGHETCCHLVTE